MHGLKRNGLLYENGMASKLPLNKTNAFQIGSHLLLAKISCMLREHSPAVAEILEVVTGES